VQTSLPESKLRSRLTDKICKVNYKLISSNVKAGIRLHESKQCQFIASAVFRTLLHRSIEELNYLTVIINLIKRIINYITLTIIYNARCQNSKLDENEFNVFQGGRFSKYVPDSNLI
jgi:hypothetical protein